MSKISTYTIIGINTIVFLIIVLLHGLRFSPYESFEILKLGASAPAISFGGEWWRTITYMFVHFSLLHLIVNTLALYFIGSFLERSLGRTRFVLAYIFSGISAALASAIWYKGEDVILLGSSGAIAGLIGAGFILFFTGIIRDQLKFRLVLSFLIFAGFNITYAFKDESGIDNLALTGGLVTGIIIGTAYYFAFVYASSAKTKFIIPVLGTVITGVFITLLISQHTGAIGIDYEAERFYSKADRKMREDEDKFMRSVQHFDILQELALEAMNAPDSLDPEKYLKDLTAVALNDWVECVNLMDGAASLSLSEEMQTKRKTLIEYSNHRIEETQFLIRSKKENTDRYNRSIDSIQQLISKMKGIPKREDFKQQAPYQPPAWDDEDMRQLPEFEEPKQYEKPYKGDL